MTTFRSQVDFRLYMKMIREEEKAEFTYCLVSCWYLWKRRNLVPLEGLHSCVNIACGKYKLQILHQNKLHPYSKYTCKQVNSEIWNFESSVQQTEQKVQVNVFLQLTLYKKTHVQNMSYKELCWL